MKTLRIIATVIMTAGFGFFGIAKIVASSIVTETAGWSRLTEWQWAAIGALEAAAVLSLLLALHPRFRSLGVAAATGLATLAVSAVVYHIINGDPVGDIAPAIIQGFVAASYVALSKNQLPATTSSMSDAALVAS